MSRRSPHAPRRAFTLIELLIVITVIAVLAGMLIPAIGMIRVKMNDVKCMSNLRNVGIGIETWRQDHDDAFPGRLKDLYSKAKNGPYVGETQKIMLCPLDSWRGTNGFNRALNWDQFPELREDLPDVIADRAADVPMPCSFLYESSECPLDMSPPAVGPSFYPIAGTQNLGTPPPGATWADGKKNQQQVGNLDAAENYGLPFPASFFPMVRCYWHRKWNENNKATDQAVNNLSWDLSVFASIPFWEHTINPAFDIP
jgi:prepilin-type N-terminal cleavage/methylation domain-containing protein